MQQLIDYYKRAHPDATEQLTRLAPAMVAAHPEAMAAFLEGVHREHGSFDDLAAAIGVRDAPERIRHNVLA